MREIYFYLYALTKQNLRLSFGSVQVEKLVRNVNIY